MALPHSAIEYTVDGRRIHTTVRALVAELANLALDDEFAPPPLAPPPLASPPLSPVHRRSDPHKSKQSTVAVGTRLIVNGSGAIDRAIRVLDSEGQVRAMLTPIVPSRDEQRRALARVKAYENHSKTANARLKQQLAHIKARELRQSELSAMQAKLRAAIVLFAEQATAKEAEIMALDQRIREFDALLVEAHQAKTQKVAEKNAAHVAAEYKKADDEEARAKQRAAARRKAAREAVGDVGLDADMVADLQPAPRFADVEAIEDDGDADMGGDEDDEDDTEDDEDENRGSH